MNRLLAPLAVVVVVVVAISLALPVRATPNLYPGFYVVVQGATATFVDQSSSSLPILSWNWSFGDGSFSTQHIPAHTYALQGIFSSFNVTLTVCSALGCASTAQTLRITDMVALGAVALFMAFMVLVLLVASVHRKKDAGR